VFFALAIAIDWFRNPQGSPDFLDTLKRAVVATILVAGFQEISQAILAVTSGIADRISDMSDLDAFFRMAGEKAKSYPHSAVSIVLGFDDLCVGLLTFISFVVMFIARYINVALYHFMWTFLSMLAPLLMLFHLFRGTSQIPVNLFKSMIEVACYKIVWAVLSAMIGALSFGNAFAADGNYLTVVLVNFIIALAMLGTPFVVKSLVGGGLTAMSESLGLGAALTIAATPARAGAVLSAGREILSNTSGFTKHMAGSAGSKLWQGIRPNSEPVIPPGLPPMPEPLPPSRQLPAPPMYMGAPEGYHGHQAPPAKKIQIDRSSK
jgi:hypothetical protein